MTERPEEIWERRISDALDRVPGYRGYRLKEERRDADRRVRAAVADAYAAELARVERIGRELANARRLGEISAVERTSQAIRHYIDRVRSATPGYGGLFGDRDIDGIALDQLRLFDESLLLGVDELRPAIDRLEARLRRRSAARPGGGRSRPDDRITARSLQYSARGDQDGRATSRDGVLAALRPIAEVIPPDVYSAQPGDAISILGDNFLVDARIDVDGRPQSFRLFRIAREPEEWLFVSREPGGAMFRMTPVTPPERGAGISGHNSAADRRGSGRRRDHRRTWFGRIARGAVRSPRRCGRSGSIRPRPRLGGRTAGDLSAGGPNLSTSSCSGASKQPGSVPPMGGTGEKEGIDGRNHGPVVAAYPGERQRPDR